MAASLLGGLPEALPRFETVEEVKEFLVAKALRDNLFGQPSYGYYPLMMNDASVSSQARVPSSGGGAAGVSVPNHSNTNNQVAGVDEADLVETDGRFLYVARNGEVVIASALSGGIGGESGADDAGLQAVSRILIQGNVVGEFLAGDRLTVISTQWYGWGVDPMFGRMAAADLPYSPSMRSQSAVTCVHLRRWRSDRPDAARTNQDGRRVPRRAGDWRQGVRDRQQQRLVLASAVGDLPIRAPIPSRQRAYRTRAIRLAAMAAILETVLWTGTAPQARPILKQQRRSMA
jgi:hypothetical protein